jgi:hypothetical protein
MRGFLAKLFPKTKGNIETEKLEKFSKEVEKAMQLFGLDAKVKLVHENDRFILKASITNEQAAFNGNYGRQVFNLQQMIYMKARIEGIHSRINLDVNNYFANRQFKEKFNQEISNPNNRNNRPYKPYRQFQNRNSSRPINKPNNS